MKTAVWCRRACLARHMLAVTILMGAVTAQAEDPETKENATDFGETVVTATKTKRPVDLQAQATSVRDRKEMDRILAQDIEDVLRYLPGVTISGGTRSLGQTPNIRGLQGSRVLTTLDGSRLTFASGHKGRIFVEPAFLSRVEVVRGPTSALQGSNGLGGAVNMRTLDPSDLLAPGQLFGVRLGVGLQSVNEEFGFSPMIFGRLAREGGGSEFEYLLGFSGRNSGDTDRGSGAGEIPFSEVDLNNVLAKVVWQPTPRDRLSLRYLLFDNQADQPRNTSSVDPNNTSNLLVDRSTRQHTYGLDYSHNDPDNPWIDVHANIYFNQLEIEETVINPASMSFGLMDAIDFDTFGFDVHNTSRLTSGETKVIFTYGVEFFRDEQTAQRGAGLLTLFPAGEADTYGFYAQAEAMFWDGLVTVIPGIRVDTYDLEAPGSVGLSESEASPKLGVLLTLDDELNLAEGDYVVFSANYTEGFRAPTFSELFISGTHFAFPLGPPPAPTGVASFIPNSGLRPESSRTVELGARLRRGPFRMRGAWFRTMADDFIELLLVNPDPALGPPFGDYQNRNVSKARLWGVEVETEYTFGKSLRVWGNYTFLRGTNETDGTPLGTMPPDFANLGIDYTWAQHGITAGVRARIFDDQARVPAGNFVSAGYTLYDAFVEWRPAGESVPEWARGFRVNLALENITDKNYVTFQGTPGHGFNAALGVFYLRSW